MTKKVDLKTKQNSGSVSAYIDSLSKEEQRDAKALLALFKQTTGLTPSMWGGSIIGFGQYTYHRSNGAAGEYFATGFSMRKSGPTIYVMPGYQSYGKLLEKLGPHKLGKSCLYLKHLSDIDTQMLVKLIKQGLADLKRTHQTNY